MNGIPDLFILITHINVTKMMMYDIQHVTLS